ncbi:MAG: tripartite tricarboxylate transporter substrate binding protein [Hyphomicrobiales bacterium]|nr:tripartite tricarboxylate transporter substrate binding protein [Hyphomicrobiales bacterium]
MSMPTVRSFVALAALVAVLVAGAVVPSALAQAPAWPTRAVKLILPLGAGSGTDTIARLFSDRLSARWARPVVVENRPGGDGIIAITSFLSANDDHTLLFTATSAFTGHPYLHAKLPYDPQALVPAARVADTLVVVAVPASLGVTGVAELVAMARAQPGKLNAASITGLLDLVFNGFLKSAGLDIAKVPYRDPVQALNDLSEGRIQVLITSITIVRAQVQAGRVRMLALTNSRPAPIAPELPTVTAAGFPDLTVDGLVGFFTTPDAAPSVRERIAADVRAIVAAEPQIAERLAAAGQVVNPGTPAQFADAIAQQKARAAAVGKLLGIAPARP